MSTRWWQRITRGYVLSVLVVSVASYFIFAETLHQPPEAIGFYTGVIASYLGASIIEVHLTLHRRMWVGSNFTNPITLRYAKSSPISCAIFITCSW